MRSAALPSRNGGIRPALLLPARMSCAAVRICQSRTFRGPARDEIQDGWVVDETLKLLVVAVVPPRNVIQTIKVMAAILRARVRRAMGGFNPLASKAAQNSWKVSSAAAARMVMIFVEPADGRGYLGALELPVDHAVLRAVARL